MKYNIVFKQEESCKKIVENIKNDLDGNFEIDANEPQIVICVGGDGTTLSAVHKYIDKLDKIIFIAFNAGHLGFFSSFNKDEYEEFIRYVKNSKFKCEEFNLLEYEINTQSNEVTNGLALNEVTIVNPRRTLILDVTIDNEYFEHYRGTGLCISTPTGSTGYNKSLHGAVIKPNLEVFQMTEIASINSNLYHTLSSPLILDKNDTIELSSEWNKELWITADSISLGFKDFRSLTVKLSDKKVKLASRNNSFLERIKKNFI